MKSKMTGVEECRAVLQLLEPVAALHRVPPPERRLFSALVCDPNLFLSIGGRRAREIAELGLDSVPGKP